MRDKIRALLLALLLATSGGLVVNGVAKVNEAGAWIVAGVLLAGLSLLLLTETK